MTHTVPSNSDHHASESSKTLLFRSEVMDAQANQWLGAICLHQPASNWLIAGFAIAITVCLVSLIVFGTVTKTARVVGVTMPTNGTVSIMAANIGVLTRCLVKEGQHVTAGQALFELSTEHLVSNGAVTALIEQQLAIRKQSLESERRLRLVQVGEKKRSIEARMLNLDTELSQIEQEIGLAQRRKALAQKSLERYEALRANDYVSPADEQQKQEELIDIDARLSSLLRSKVQVKANRLAVETEQAGLASTLATDLEQLKNSQASLNQEITENQNRNTNLIVAPKSGTVSTITYQPGQAVNATQALATLILDPDTSASPRNELEVHLFAPGRTIGFVAAGQSVLIRYQAYPYQKFGLQEGKIIDVSKTPFAPSELPTHIASTILSNAQQNINGSNSQEALYRIRVNLKRQTILAYGQEQSLKPSMTLDADILQDNRKIWEWIAEPVLAAQKIVSN